MHKPLKVVGRDGATAVESTFSGSIGNLIPGGKGEHNASTDTAAQTTKARNQTTPTLSEHDEPALILDKLFSIGPVGSLHSSREAGDRQLWYSMEGVSRLCPWLF